MKRTFNYTKYLLILVIILVSQTFSQNDYKQGVDAYSKEDYETAIKYFTKYIDKNPDKDDGYYARGLCYESVDKCVSAKYDYNKALEINPKHKDALLGRGNSFDCLGQYSMAIESFNTLLTLYPDYAKGYWNRSATYINYGTSYMMDQFEAFSNALADIEKAVELDNSYQNEAEETITSLRKKLKELSK